MTIIRFELVGELDKTPGKSAEALVAVWGDQTHLGLDNPEFADGDDMNPTYVTDAFGRYEGKGGGPGVRGSVGYAVWMGDSQRFEVLSLTGP